MKIIFAERLKNLRKEMNLSQAQLAKNLGTTQRKISYWELGKTEPDLASLSAISEFFGVSIDYLCGKTEF